MREKHLAKLIASVVVSSIFLTGCGGDATEQAVAVQNEENNSDITGIHVTDGAKYQFQVIDPEDIVIEYSGLKPDQSLAKYKGKYVTDTSVYLSNQVGVYLGEDHYTATVGEYVQYTDINWKWDSNNNWDMFVNTRNGSVEGDASMFEGIIDYADGTQSSVTADSVELGFEDNGNMEVVSIKFRDDTYTYKFAIPEAWWDEGDGSDLSAEDLEALRGQDTEMTQDGSSTAVMFSEKDAPGLTKLDWAMFNDILNNDGFYHEDVSKELFANLLYDKRIDWSLVNEEFDSNYGNTTDGIRNFITDVGKTGYSGLIYKDGIIISDEFLDKVGLWYGEIFIKPISQKYQNGDYATLEEDYKANVVDWKSNIGYSEEYGMLNSEEGLIADVYFFNGLGSQGVPYTPIDSDYSEVLVVSSMRDLVGNYRNQPIKDGSFDEGKFKRIMQASDSLLRQIYPENYESFKIAVNTVLVDENGESLSYDSLLN